METMVFYKKILGKGVFCKCLVANLHTFKMLWHILREKEVGS